MKYLESVDFVNICAQSESFCARYGFLIDESKKVLDEKHLSLSNLTSDLGILLLGTGSKDFQETMNCLKDIRDKTQKFNTSEVMLEKSSLHAIMHDLIKKRLSVDAFSGDWWCIIVK